MVKKTKTNQSKIEGEKHQSSSNIGLEHILSKLSDKLDAIIDKMGSKNGGRWERFQILTSFISSVLFAGVGLYFTTVYNNRESVRLERQQEAELEIAKAEQKRQAEAENAQRRIAELEAITSLTPLLASKDEGVKRYAWITLQALYEGRSVSIVDPYSIDSVGMTRDKAMDVRRSSLSPNVQGTTTPLLLKFAQIALADNATLEQRTAAVKELHDIAVSPATAKKTREEATGLVAKVAVSEKVPEQVRIAASNYLKDIKSFPIEEIGARIAELKVERAVEEIILHHTDTVQTDSYRGAETVCAMAKVAIEQNTWAEALWHFMVAPDGAVWTGRPLDINFTGVQGYGKEAVSVTLIMNGDRELPTAKQKQAVGVLLAALCKKFNIDPLINFSEGRGFHRDHGWQSAKSCPGIQVTKELVLGWMQL